MAMFKQHIAFGAIVSTLGVVLLFFYGLLTSPTLLGVAFFLCILGSFLPDVDSDSGTPFYLMFGATTLGFAGAVLYYFLNHRPANDLWLFGAPLLALVLFWFIAGTIFKHITHHRGIWHSLPALAIFASLTYIISTYLGATHLVALIFAAATGAGFLSHLALDEIYSEVNMDGSPFAPKRSVGTALKLFTDSGKVNLLTYGLLLGLLFFATSLSV
jgi:hypothetical protein